MSVSRHWMVLGCLCLAGCMTEVNQTAPPPVVRSGPVTPAPTNGTAPETPATGGATTPETPPSTGGATTPAAKLTPVSIDAGIAVLSPDNSRIGFVGTHIGPKPDPRTGGFGKFAGTAEVDIEGKTLKAVSVEIETGSLWTEIPKLTNHLNSPDFFDAKEYPTARFTSTKIEPAGEPGKFQITGDLTLLAATHEITFPAQVTIDESGLTLKSEFTVDRTEFGMNHAPDQVEKNVTLTVVVGEQTVTK